MAFAWTNLDEPLKRKILRLIARPIVQLCLRCSYSLQDLIELLKELFVEMAQVELTSQKIKCNVSRLSVVTGIQRAEIRRILDADGEGEPAPRSLLMKVIGQWHNDPAFSTQPGHPKLLTFKGKKAEFRRLCEKVSTTLNPGTVQFEFERKNFITRVDTKLQLVYKAMPLGEEPQDAFRLLSREIDDLIHAVEENILNPEPVTNLHLHTEYDNVVARHVPTIRQWLIEEGKEFHRKVRNFVSQFDKDINSELVNEEGEAKISVTAFGRTMLKP